MIKRDDFDFDKVNFPFLGSYKVTFLAERFMVYTFCNLLGLLDSAIMFRTSTRDKNV